MLQFKCFLTKGHTPRQPLELTRKYQPIPAKENMLCLLISVLVLYLLYTVQAFSFSTSLADPSMVDIEPVVGFLHTCPDYSVVLQPRA